MEKGKHENWKVLLRRWWPYLVLSAIFFLHVAGLFWFLAADQTPPYKDVGHQYLLIPGIAQGFREGGFLLPLWEIYFSSPVDDGPIFEMLAVPLVLVFGDSHDVVTSTNIFFLAILLWSTYALGRDLFSRDAGLLAATIVGCYPAVFYTLRLSMVDHSLAAMVTLCMWGLVRSEGFTDRRMSKFLGLFLGLAALSKISFPLFLLIPFAVETIRSLNHPFREGGLLAIRGRLLNLLYCLGISSLMALPWYIMHIPQFIAGFVETYLVDILPGQATFVGFLHATLIEEWLLTDWTLLFTGLFTSVIFVAVCIALAFLLLGGQHRWLLLGWAVPVFFFFPILYGSDALLDIDHLRYFAPIFPVTALILSSQAVRLLSFLKGVENRGPFFRLSVLWPLLLAIILMIHVNLYMVISTDGALGASALIYPLDRLYEVGVDPLPTLSRSTDKLKPNRLFPRLDEAGAQIVTGAGSDDMTILIFNGEGRFGHAMGHKLSMMAWPPGLSSEVVACSLDRDSYNLLDVRSFLSPDNCQERMKDADVVILDPWFEREDATPASWDEPTSRLLTDKLFNGDFHLLYAVRSFVLQSELPLEQGEMDYLATDPGPWGSYYWQRPIEMDALEGLGGLIYVRS